MFFNLIVNGVLPKFSFLITASRWKFNQFLYFDFISCNTAIKSHICSRGVFCRLLRTVST